MSLKRIVVMMMVVTLLTTGILRPQPARADTTETVILVVIGLAGYAAFVILCTYLIYGKAFPSPSVDDMDEGIPLEPPSPTLRFGHHCKQSATNVTVLCW